MPHIRFCLSGSFQALFAQHPANALSKRIESEHAADFWQDERDIPFADRQGCDIFALRDSKGHTPLE